MARIFITGSADGLGQLSAKELIEQGHEVVLHARIAERARDALKKNPKAEAVLTGDLSNIEETKRLASQVNEYGEFDAVIHNAGVYRATSKEILAVNVLAPYILTRLIQKPKRLIYLTSGMHLQGNANLDSITNHFDRMNYSDSKLYVVMLCEAVAKKWNDVYANSVNPGWVPTKMGGRGAPDDLQKGYETQVWLAASNDEKVKVTGKYFHHKKERSINPIALDDNLQEVLIKKCEHLTDVIFS